MLIDSQCLSCRHWRRGWRCAAFPEGIPDDVTANRVDHRRAQPNDHGVRWAPSEPGSVHPMEPVTRTTQRRGGGA